MGTSAIAVAKGISRRCLGTRRKAFGVEGGPASLPCPTLFVAHPAASWSDITEDDRLGTERIDRPVEQGPVVALTFAVGPFAVGAVKPLLEKRSVGLMHLAKRSREDIVVAARTIGGMIAIPRRYIDTH